MCHERVGRRWQTDDSYGVCRANGSQLLDSHAVAATAHCARCDPSRVIGSRKMVGNSTVGFVDGAAQMGRAKARVKKQSKEQVSSKEEEEIIPNELV